MSFKGTLSINREAGTLMSGTQDIPLLLFAIIIIAGLLTNSFRTNVLIGNFPRFTIISSIFNNMYQHNNFWN